MKRPPANKRPKGKRGESALIDRLGGKLPKPSRQATARVGAWLAAPPPRRWRRLFADIQLRHKFSAVLPKRHHTCGTRLRMILRSYGICSAPIRIELSTR